MIPKAALSLESISDTVYVAAGEVAARREVELGCFNEGDFVEVIGGIAAEDRVVVVGQDGLSDGTPIQILAADGEMRVADSAPGEASPAPGVDPASMSPEQRERARAMMRDRGMSEEQIEQRLAGDRTPTGRAPSLRPVEHDAGADRARQGPHA